jgi:hypothetical protein
VSAVDTVGLATEIRGVAHLLCSWGTVHSIKEWTLCAQSADPGVLNAIATSNIPFDAHLANRLRLQIDAISHSA